MNCTLNIEDYMNRIATSIDNLEYNINDNRIYYKSGITDDYMTKKAWLDKVKKHMNDHFAKKIPKLGYSDDVFKVITEIIDNKFIPYIEYSPNNNSKKIIEEYVNDFHEPKADKTESDVKKEIRLGDEVNESNIPLILSRLKKYNQSSGTKHRIEFEQIGETQRYKPKLILNFNNIEDIKKEKEKEKRIEEAREVQREDAKRAGVEYDDNYLKDLEVNRVKEGVSELFESNPELANAVYEALGFKSKSFFSSNWELFNSNEFNDLHILAKNDKKTIIRGEENINEILDRLENSTNPVISNIITLIRPFISVKKIILNFEEQGGSFNGSILEIGNFDTNEEFIITLIHELLHSATLVKLEQLARGVGTKEELEIYKQLKDLYEFAKNKAKEDGKSFYGLIDLHEFISELFTSKDFFDWANNTNYKNNSIISIILDTIKKLFGVNKNSIAEEGFELAFKIMQTQRQSFNMDKKIAFSKNSSNNQITPQQKQQAQQLYSQYLDSLNKPNTNPILQTNQQEQVKKFAELQERLNNKEFLEGAKNAYENSEGLKSFGTQEQYNDYIARVSLGIIKNPSSGEYNYTSKVKDIVYHAGRPGIEKFDKRFIGSGSGVKKGSKGFYFADTIDALWNYEERLYAVEDGSKRYSVLLNVKNPELSEFQYEIKTTEKDGKIFRRYGNPIQTIKENKSNKDSEHIRIIYPEYETYSYPVEKYIISQEPNPIKNEYVVFEPEQIHILGSKQDIEGFKEFVNKDNINQDLQNLHLTTPVLESLYENSSKSKDFITFVKDLKKMIAIWQNSGRTNEEILEMIKCL